MKKIFVAIAIVLMVATAAWAITWHTANQSTVAWDPVTQNSSGDPIDPAEIKYDVYLKNAITGGAETKITEAPIDLTQHTITLNVEGKFYVGVQAVRIVGGEVVSTSAIAWSDDPQYVQGDTFGIQYFLPPKAPGNIRKPN